MTAQPELEYPSEPLSGDVLATVELVGGDWRADEDWRRFEAACRFVATREEDRSWTSSRGEVVYHYGVRQFVDPNHVRAYLGGSIEPRRYSAFWSRASRGKGAFLVADGWVVNTDHASGNAGKPLRRYRLREAS